jgi:CBS domain-containing protein
VTKLDIVKFIASRSSSLHISVGDVMTIPVITIGPLELLTAAIMRMNLKGVKKLVVLDGMENLIGIITQTDISSILKK